MNRILLFLAFLIIIFSRNANAAIVYVDSAHVGGTQTGTSWATAFSSFQSGIDAANAGDSVWVAKGTYQPPLDASIIMKAGVKIFGGFLNTNSLFSQRNFRVNKSILKGSNASVVRNSNNGLTPEGSRIDGFTITGGSSESLNAGSGGGMANFMSSPTVANCIFTLNVLYGSSNYIGGGMYNGYCSPVIINCTFIKNWSTDGSGGAMYNKNASPIITNCVFAKNSVGGYGKGGGIYNNESSPLLTNCTFVGNISSAVEGGAGAAMYSFGGYSAPILSNCIVWGNKVESVGWGPVIGSGLYGGSGGLYYSLVQGIAASPASDTITHMIDGGTNPLFIDTAAGNYRLQSSSPCINAGNNDTIPSDIATDIAGYARIYNAVVDMGAYEFHAQPSITLGQDTTICSGSMITLNAQNIGSTYLWSTGATTQSIDVNTSGTYYVTATNDMGANKDTIVVTVQPNPAVDLGNDTAICIGTAIDLVLNAQNSGGSYLWNDASTNQTLDVNAAGAYDVTVTDANGCKGYDTIQISVAVLPLVDLGNDTTFCAGNGLTLNAQNSGAAYLWSTGASTQTININTTGTYGVEVTDANGCKGNDTIQATANPSPIVNLGVDVTINAASYTINAGNAGATYLWNTGATTQTLTVTTNGTYSVVVTNANGCSASDTIEVAFQPNGIDDVNTARNDIKVIPNPAKDVIYIQTQDNKLLNQPAILTDAYGRTVRMITIKSRSQELSLTGLADGMYFLKMQTGGTLKIVKE